MLENLSNLGQNGLELNIVFVNSGSSANFLTLAVLSQLKKIKIKMKL